jgi:hypothetical protein
MGKVLGQVAGYMIGEIARALQSYTTALCRQICDVVAILVRVGPTLDTAFPQTGGDGRLAWLALEALVRVADSLADNRVLRIFLSNRDMRFVLRRLAQRWDSLWSDYQYKIDHQ